MVDHKLLKSIYLFKNLTTDQLELISSISEYRTYDEGDDIFAEKDEAKALYVINYGSVRVHQKMDTGENLEVATLSIGSHFGEMAFLDSKKRSATVTACEKTEMVEVEYEKLATIIKDHLDIAVVFYQGLSHFLCGRLRLTTNDLSFARQENYSYF